MVTMRENEDYHTICKMRTQSRECTVTLDFVFRQVVGGVNAYIFPKQTYSSKPIEQIGCLAEHVQGMSSANFMRVFGKFKH